MSTTAESPPSQAKANIVTETIYLCRDCDAIYNQKPKWCQECSPRTREPFSYFKGTVTFDTNSTEGARS